MSTCSARPVAEEASGAGSESWYGNVFAGGRRVKRKLGPKREPGPIDLTKHGAERELRELITALKAAPPARERLAFAIAVEQYLRYVGEVRQLRWTTVRDYRQIVQRHLNPFFAGKSIEAIDPDMIEAYMVAKAREGLAPKTITNHLALLGGIFRHAMRKGWVGANPVAAVDRPAQRGSDRDICYFDSEEIDALIRAVPGDRLGGVDRVLYLTAAMTGLRQGELVALRWRDVDWRAGVVRVRRSYTSGEFTVPKSHRSSRAVPMADRLGRELERHFQRSRFQGDEDLVFANPLSGGPYDASKIRKRFKDAIARSGLRQLRFHDLRHTFGTQMAAAGAPLRAVQDWMGHQDYKTTSIYVDYAPDSSQGARWAAKAFGRDRSSAHT
jgi:integrase